MGFVWLRVECDDGHIWANGVFHERWGIACLARWLSGSYEDSAPGRVMCSVLSTHMRTHTHTHTVLSIVFMHLPSVQSFYFNGSFPADTHQILKLLCVFIRPLLIHAHYFMLHIWRWDVLHIYCLIGVYCLNCPFCIAYSCVLNTASLRVWCKLRFSDSFVVRSNPSIIS